MPACRQAGSTKCEHKLFARPPLILWWPSANALVADELSRQWLWLIGSQTLPAGRQARPSGQLQENLEQIFARFAACARKGAGDNCY